MTRDQLRKLDRIIRTIPRHDHDSRGPVHRALKRGATGLLTRDQLQTLDRIIRTIPRHDDRGPTHRTVAPCVTAVNHPPVGGLKSLRDYQALLNAHYEKERLEAERKPAPRDPVAGVRDALGLAGRRGDFNWLKGCN